MEGKLQNSIAHTAMKVEAAELGRPSTQHEGCSYSAAVKREGGPQNSKFTQTWSGQKGFVEARPLERRKCDGYVEALKEHHIRHLIEEHAEWYL